MQNLKWGGFRKLTKTDYGRALAALRQFKPGYGHRSAMFAIEGGKLYA